MGVTIWPTIFAILSASSAVPIAYIFNTYATNLKENVSLGIVVVAVILLFQLIVFMLMRRRVKNNLYYGLVLLCFTSVMELMLSLERCGYIKGFMRLYLNQAEPYLDSIPTTILCYYFGTVGFVFYITMIYCLTNGSTYKNIGLHTSAASLNSVTVLFIAQSLGQSDLCNSILTRAPFVTCYICLMVSCFGEKRNCIRYSSFIDKVLALLLLGGAATTVIKGLVCLGHESSFIYWYENDVEPIMKQTTPLPVFYVQGLLSFFYFLPAYLVLAGALLMNSGQEWVQNLSSILAGATLQAGIITIGSSIHPLTHAEYKVSFDSRSPEFIVFWCGNLLMALTPQLVAWRLSCGGQKVEKGHYKKDTLKKIN